MEIFFMKDLPVDLYLADSCMFHLTLSWDMPHFQFISAR